jgi:hypothetical protein
MSLNLLQIQIYFKKVKACQNSKKSVAKYVCMKILCEQNRQNYVEPEQSCDGSWNFPNSVDSLVFQPPMTYVS